MSEDVRNLLKGWDVLVVDDEADSLMVAQYILEYHGATVHVARDGAEGYEQASKVRPRFIVSDISMPDVDGWQLIEKLKNDVATMEIPVIALSAHAMHGDRERAIAAGFHNYLTKPLTAETFIRNLLALLIDVPEISRDLPEEYHT